jgi:hypothetical protein
MIYKGIKIFAVLGVLAGCSAVQQKVEMDASAAAMIAANAGDAAGRRASRRWSRWSGRRRSAC